MSEIIIKTKKDFENAFRNFINTLSQYVSDEMHNWTIKGFIDINKNIYTISTDTKIISKILEIHIFPLLFKFAEDIGYKIVLPEYQNYYPDITFVCKEDESIKFAVDLKSTYRINTFKCNGFTLGSHGTYFKNRESTKNIQFPYNQYKAHYCLGIIYTRVEKDNDETTIYKLSDLLSISSVIKDITFFFEEKWKIASDVSGSGNTANIGSIKSIKDLCLGNGTFAKYGEKLFDDYWINYGNIIVITDTGKSKRITKLAEFLKYKRLNK